MISTPSAASLPVSLVGGAAADVARRMDTVGTVAGILTVLLIPAVQSLGGLGILLG